MIEEGVCLFCRDEGGDDGPCSGCGKVKEIILVENFESNSIPERYRSHNRIFSSKVLAEGFPQFEGNPEFKTYSDSLQNIISTVKTTGKLGDSFLIVSPPGLAKRTFVYTIMREYIKKGCVCPPIMDDVQLRSILSSPTQKFLGLDYEDLLSVPLIVYQVPFNTFANLSYTRLLDLVLSRRSRNLDTIIISSRSLSSITKYDKDRLLLRYVNQKGIDNSRGTYPLQLILFNAR